MKRWRKTNKVCRRLLFCCVGMALLLATYRPSSAQILPPDTTQLSVHSEPGDPWGQHFGKSDWFYQSPPAQFINFAGGPNNEVVTGVQFVVRMIKEKP